MTATPVPAVVDEAVAAAARQVAGSSVGWQPVWSTLLLLQASWRPRRPRTQQAQLLHSTTGGAEPHAVNCSAAPSQPARQPRQARVSRCVLHVALHGSVSAQGAQVPSAHGVVMAASPVQLAPSQPSQERCHARAQRGEHEPSPARLHADQARGTGM